MATTRLHHISANETELHLGENTIFFSYDTPVAYHVSGVGYFRTDRKFSQTTSKHITRWLGGAHAETVSQTNIENFVNSGNGAE